MWNNREAKALARKNLKSRYWMMVVTCLILIFLGVIQSAGANVFEVPSIGAGDDGTQVSSGQTPAIVDFVNEKLAGNDEKAAIIATEIIHSYKGTGGFLYSMFMFIDKLILSGSFAGTIIVIIAILVFLIYYMFIINILHVGFYRMMMELRTYKGTKWTRIFSMFKRKGYINLSIVMIIFTLFVSLFLLIAVAPVMAGVLITAVTEGTMIWPAIVGALLSIAGVVLFVYEYFGVICIPYILAFNPEVKAGEALKLSREMMKGNRKHLFGFFLSFIGWDILNILTVGLLGVFFVTPYKYLAQTEVFIRLRENALDSNMAYSYYLEDELLDNPPEDMETYPDTVPQKENKIAKYVADMNPTRKYTIINLLLMFFIFSFVGKAWEVLLHLVKDGEFINRGTMYGPWLPIYGTAGVLIIFLLRRLASHPAILFVVIMAVCGVMEYVTHWYIQVTKGIQYWNYSNYFLNLNGRIALEGLLIFAILGTFFIYVGAPFVDNVLNKFSTKSKIIALCILTVCFVIDKIYSHYHPKTGKGITDYKHKSKLSSLPDGTEIFDPKYNIALQFLERKI